MTRELLVLGYQIGWFTLKPKIRPLGSFIFLRETLKNMVLLEDILGVLALLEV